MNKSSIAKLRDKLNESMKDFKEKLDRRDLEGSKNADIRTAAIRKEFKKRKLEIEIELY